MNDPAVSIVCVTFNSADTLPAFLQSLEKLPAVWYEAIFVDNNSTDTTVEKIKKWNQAAAVIQNRQNLGWSAANNQGIETAKSNFIFIANPDIWFEAKGFQCLVRFLDEHPHEVAVAPQLLNPDGSIQASCRRLPGLVDFIFQMSGLAFLFPKTFFNRWKMPEFDHQSFRHVEQPMASALLIRRAAFRTVGRLDERFFVFFGDVDFCRRLKNAGFQIAFLPEAKVFHRRGASTRLMGPAFYLSSHFGFFRYLWKLSTPYQKPGLLLLWPLAVMTAVGRAAAGLIFRR